MTDLGSQSKRTSAADKNWVTVVTSGIGAGPCKLTREREITPYVWVHPDEER
jgi:hypothetical protein